MLTLSALTRMPCLWYYNNNRFWRKEELTRESLTLNGGLGKLPMGQPLFGEDFARNVLFRSG